MDFLSNIFKYDKYNTVCGLVDEAAILYYLNYFNNNDSNVLILTNSLYDANKIYKRLKTYTENVYLFPMDDFLSSVAIAMSPDLKISRLDTLENLNKKPKSIVVTNLMGYLHYLPSLSNYNELILSINKGDIYSRDKLISKLNDLGYKNTSLVTSTGEYAVRGFIVDLFPIDEKNPIRFEFFDDEIDSIRFFDAETQLSINEITSYRIRPIDEIISDNYSSLYDYMKNPFTFIVNQGQINQGLLKLKEDIEEYNLNKGIANKKYMFDFDEIEIKDYLFVDTINNYNDGNVYNTKEIINFNGDLNLFKDYINNNKNKYKIKIFLSKEKQIETIKEILGDVENIEFINKKINQGFIFDDYLIISEYDILNDKIKNVYKNSYKIGRKIKDFNDLKRGDYVVHSQHGIGIYDGIVPIEKNGMVRDYIKINYLKEDKVYVPVEKISTIYKYSDSDGARPTINSLNSSQWIKTKNKVRNRIKDISDELIKLYAARANTKGPVFIDYPEEDIFAHNFEYDETKDQIRSINDVLHDLNSSIPMDRLLCGDVGFGKTEVAFRGIFKTIINGYQVAYLCPTTLLSRQQYHNALERFKEFPINIVLLNRFTSVKETNRIIKGLKEGTIDLVFGTHKLLNDKIEYKNLGLLVVDEEQRFGVTHKEKIKKIKNDVNVLTLSATPIPRTLKMAMSGLRDLSIIDTAPINRYPIQTYVLEENDILIKDAIYKELAREGQIFILYNRVESIEDLATKLRILIPEASIVIAHGQMEKNQLEEVVTNFIDHKYDILLCTTIIETGIDIPNVNTLIIYDADNFGLSQLYQIRGRVGRSDKIAYAYLMYKPSKLLTETAIKRLNSIKDFTELGSGYKIAMRDLAIRGSGDLLGSEQAGFIDSVGLELYTQMVNDEIKRINGEEIEEDVFTNPLIEVENHISDDYVKEESLKIEIHKLINEISNKESLDKIKNEIEDRFGKVNENMMIYMYEEWFEKLAQKLNITRVNNRQNIIELELPQDLSNKLEGDKLFLTIYNINPKFKISYKMRKIYISLSLLNLEKHFIYYLVPLLDEIINMTNNN